MLRAWTVTLLLAVTAVAAHSQAPIVSNPAPNPNAPAFRLSARPVIAVGGLHSDPHYELTGARVATVTATGRLIIAPHDVGGRNGELRVFDSLGRFERTIGRGGKGPGEFTQIVSMTALRGDTVAVYDNLALRLTVFDVRSGRIVREIAGVKEGHCCFLDGTMIGPSKVTPAPPGQPPTITWVHYTRSTSATDSLRPVLTTVGSDPLLQIQGPEQPTTPVLAAYGITSTGTISKGLPFGRSSRVAPAGGVMVAARADRFEYRVYSPNGTLQRTVRVTGAPSPVTTADVDSARRDFVQHIRPGLEDVLRAEFNKLKLHTTKPAFQSFRTETDGSVWFHGYTGADQPQVWTRFDPTGRLLGILRIPPDHRVLDFAHGSAVLIVRNDADGTATVRVHRIERIARAPD